MLKFRAVMFGIFFSENFVGTLNDEFFSEV
jgi:hypothetical protein